MSGLGGKFGHKKGVVGIEMLSNGLAVAVRGTQTAGLESLELLLKSSDGGAQVHKKNGAASVSAANSSASSSINEMANLLIPFVEKHHLSKLSCEIILAPDDYQLLLVEAPEVPDEELKEAVRWRIKDLISLPVDDVVIDVFTLPDDASRAGKKMVYVVVVEFVKIKAIVDMVASAGLNLQSIDIGEFALRNLVLHADESRGSAIVRINGGQGILSIYRSGNLYLSRQFKLDYDGGLLTELPAESFALEIQRSLDYFERQMGQAPPGVIYVCGESISEDKVTEELSRGLTIPINFFDVKGLLNISSDLDDGMTQLCVGAIGAVYRSEAA